MKYCLKKFPPPKAGQALLLKEGKCIRHKFNILHPVLY
jgi:hypothetical protein